MTAGEAFHDLWADWNADEHAMVCGGQVLLTLVEHWPEGDVYRIWCPTCGFVGSPTLIIDLEDGPPADDD
jgi:hypothetical protein